MGTNDFDLKQLIHEQVLRIVIDKLCKIRDKTLRDLAIEVDVSPSCLSFSISGKRKTTPRLEDRIRQAFGVKTDVWHTIINNVKELIMKDEPIDSIEMWFAIMLPLYKSEGKYVSKYLMIKTDEINSDFT